MSAVHIRGLGKDKSNARGTNRILHSVSIDITDGEFLVLVGPSGCGKTTLLRCIAGLEAPTRGQILIDDKLVNDVEPRDRDIAMVFQSYALYPHLSVRENLAFGLRMRKTPQAQMDRLIEEAAAMLDISHLLQRLPRELSGGQRQRVAMGRAVVRRPKVFLFDEPLSNLDAALRQQMRVELLRLHKRLGTTMVYVTHDQIEAMTLASRIAVMNQGALEQVGPPQDVYNRPGSLFVARFLGSPEMNTFPGAIQEGVFRSQEAPTLQVAAPGLPDGPATLGVRAEDLHLCAEGDPGATPVTVDVIEQLGWESLLHLQAGPHRLIARCEAARAPAPGRTVGVMLPPERVHLFASEGRRLSAGQGRRLPGGEGRLDESVAGWERAP